MKRVADSKCMDRENSDSRTRFINRWALVAFCGFFLPIGIVLSAAVGHSATIKPKDYSASASYLELGIPQVTPTPDSSNNGKVRLRGYVYNRDRAFVPSLKVVLTNTATGNSITHNVNGNFLIYIPKGRYDISMRDRKGNLNRYSDIVINGDSTIKFSFGNYREPTVAPTPSPTPDIPVTPTPMPSVSPSPIVTPTDRPSVSPTPIVIPTPDNTGGNDEIIESNTNSNVEIEPNANTFTPKTTTRPKPPTKVSKKGFSDRLLTFLTTNPLKIALTILTALAVLGILANLPTWLAGLSGGFGLAGTTDSGDDVKCTLYSPPEIRTGNDLLVQVFAHLPEQGDELDEMAKMLDPEAKKQLSKSLKRKIKRDSVLTFKLMIPGIELVEDEQDLVWRGEPDSVEFIVPIPLDHGDGNRFGRVYVYENGEDLGKIPFRINIISKEQPIAVEKIEPRIAGVMTQNETAFVSYASKDKDEVYRFVQLMDVLKYDYHIDVFHIEAGERWERKLYEFIDTDDVFLLFWSESASKSEWVIKEAKRAEERAKADPSERPRIIIYRLDESIPIPEWLEDFHVDRKWAGMIENINSHSGGFGGTDQ